MLIFSLEKKRNDLAIGKLEKQIKAINASIKKKDFNPIVIEDKPSNNQTIFSILLPKPDKNIILK